MAKVYVAHIGENDQQKVIDIASTVGKVMSSTAPRLSKEASRKKYSAGVYGPRTGLSPRYSYYMFITMETAEQANVAVSKIGSTSWDHDYDYTFTSIHALDIPLMYAEIARK